MGLREAFEKLVEDQDAVGGQPSLEDITNTLQGGLDYLDTGEYNLGKYLVKQALELLWQYHANRGS